MIPYLGPPIGPSIFDYKCAAFYWQSNGFEFPGQEQHTSDPATGLALIADTLMERFSDEDGKVPENVVARFVIDPHAPNFVALYFHGMNTKILPEQPDFQRVQHLILSDVLRLTVSARAYLPELEKQLDAVLSEQTPDPQQTKIAL